MSVFFCGKKTAPDSPAQRARPSLLAVRPSLVSQSSTAIPDDHGVPGSLVSHRKVTDGAVFPSFATHLKLSFLFGGEKRNSDRKDENLDEGTLTSLFPVETTLPFLCFLMRSVS